MYIHIIMYICTLNLLKLNTMIRKITMSLIAAAAVTAFAFKAPTKTINYAIDSKATSATWLAKKVTGEHAGGIKISKGNVMSDGKNLTGGTFEFDMTSITCTDLKEKEWNDKLIGHLNSEDFFNVSKNPTATFELTKSVLKSGNDFELTGKLTIKGITNEITFPAMIKMDAKKLVTIAKITVNRTKFDIKYGSASFFESLGDKAISDDFELNINVVATVGK
jgi:polyisoprenoid-binding protein YceI